MYESLRSDFLWYWNDYLLRFPDFLFLMLISVTCLGIVVLLSWKGLRRGIVLAGRLLLVEALFVIYSSTIIFRPVNSVEAYDFTPFWSYKAILDGESFLLAENIMNVVVFIPLGLLLGCSVKVNNWWKTLLVGTTVSLSIEILQFVFRKGFSEFDDVIHNTLGCAIGYALYSIVRIGYKDLSNNHLSLSKFRKLE